MSQYLTKPGDTLDQICAAHYGSTGEGQVEFVLESNRALDLGQYIILPAGLTLTLPTIPPKTNEIVRLFS
jgi:phage tail protein X